MTTDAVDSRRTFLATGMKVQEKTEAPEIYSRGLKSPLKDNLEVVVQGESVMLPELKIKKTKDSTN